MILKSIFIPIQSSEEIRNSAKVNKKGGRISINPD